ncbi:protein geranylgeranyltransferase type I subunit CDC43 [Sugiyamaella lignohabitans]|uniref:Protein geranylgeranyltransferase type I subunit CDC43 n=1 Tax=Sugiyamaella lignohabitans TaxID=796027 RepID=A0A167CRH3_9ASCO|nr:protein geranylgeranyltransferase type I subunit CDC43 [Sugiyamaella lignohabitans]ANB12021.1 protein geranylgeranyltransferase type I subunit CDC43 [Sugiyamaella lignohabitans]
MPSAYTSYDSSHVSLVYFCIAGLKLLNALTEVIPNETDRSNWIEWVYLHLTPSGNGFRGSLSHDLQQSTTLDGDNINDPAHLASTFFCLSILAILQDRSMTTRLDRVKILRYVKSCQRSTGQFSGLSHPSIGPVGDNDPRYTYVAAAIRRILKGDQLHETLKAEVDFNVKKASDFIKSTKSYDGGLGDKQGSESHAGLVFCGIAALDLMNTLNCKDWVDTAVWLSKRQLSEFTIDHSYSITADGDYDQHSRDNDTRHGASSFCCWNSWEAGGFNGRLNKPADTCYAYWTCASLTVLNSANFVSSPAARTFLLENCMDPVLGGMVKVKGSYADPLHSYLGLAALAMISPELGFCEFNPSLTLPVETVSFIDTLDWNPL